MIDTIIGRCSGRTKPATFLVYLAWIGLLSAVIVPTTTAQQGPRTIDLTAKLLPRSLPEVQDALNYSVSDSIGSHPVLPLELTVQSISRLSVETQNAFVDVVIRNTGKRSFSVPVSRDISLRVARDNKDRRSFSCLMNLTNEISKERVWSTGFTTFSSSTDPDSVVELRPGESMQFLFEANFKPMSMETSKWKEGISNRLVLAAVACGQDTYTPINVANNQRQFTSDPSELRLSTNTLRIAY